MAQSDLMKQLSANLPCPVCGTPLISLGSALDGQSAFGPRTKWPAIALWLGAAIAVLAALVSGKWLMAVLLALFPAAVSWATARARKNNASRPVVCTGCNNYFDARDLT